MKEKINGKAWLFVCVSILVFLLFGLKCFISTKGATDEIYYIATAYRFYQGDAMLVDDWNAAQMSGFLLLPFVYLYMFIMKTTEGIILFFRFLYLIFKVLVAVFCIRKLKKYGKFGVLGVSVYYFFSPQNLDALSYNTIALGMIMMIGAICLTEKRKKQDYYVCGLLLAIAVLAQPFCILIYLAGAAVVIWEVLKRKSGDRRWQPIEEYVILTAGAFTMLLIFAAFIFSRASGKEILENLHFILNDKNHNVAGMSGLLTLLLKPVRTAYHILKNYTALSIINTVWLIVVLVVRLWRKQYVNYLAYGSILCLLLSCVAVIATGRPFLENEFFIPFIWFSVEELILIGGEREKYNCVWGLAFLTALAFCLSTDTGIISTSAGLCIMAVFNVIMLPEILTDEALKVRFVGERQLLILSAGISTCVFSMRILCTWTNSLLTGDYSYYIEKGPLKGTYTDEASYRRFYIVMSDLDRISYTEDDILFCGRNTPSAYLYSGMVCGTMSTYLLDTDYERLEQYYALHPDKFPSVVYYYPVGSYPVTEQDMDSAFFQYIQSNYEVLEIEDRILAIRNTSKQ